MDTIQLKKALFYGASGIICLLLFILSFKDSNDYESYKQACYTSAFDAKVTRIKRSRDYYITGEDAKGKSTEFEVYDVWNLKGLQVGDSIVKHKGEWKIKIVKKDTTLYVEPEFPVQ